MITADASVVVAAALPWHTLHQPALASLDVRPSLGAHACLEAYSVLTRLPAPGRVPPDAAWEFILDRFGPPAFGLDAGGYAGLLDELVGRGVSGGAVYDALVARSAQAAGATLLSLDRRAAAVYDAVGVTYRLIA